MRFPDVSILGTATIEGAGQFEIIMRRLGVKAATVMAMDVAVALETEWYNGNIDEHAYRRLCKQLGLEENPTAEREKAVAE